MDAVVGFLNNAIVLTVVQLLFGFAVKKWSVLAAWPNRLIPLFNAVLAVLIKVAGPAEAQAATIGVIALFGIKASWLGAVLTEAILQTLTTTGLHSSFKNLAQQIGVAATRPR